MYRDTLRRLTAASLVTLFLVIAPSAFGLGLSDVAFELPDLSQIWVKISALWTGETGAADSIDEVDLHAELHGELDPVGDDGGDDPTQQPASVVTALTETLGQPTTSSAP